MGWEAGQWKRSTPLGIFIMTPSLEGWPTKAKEAPSPHEIRLTLLDTNPVFQSLGETKLCSNIALFHVSSICILKHTQTWPEQAVYRAPFQHSTALLTIQHEPSL